MNNPIIKVIRFLIFIPVCIIAMGIINWGIFQLFSWLLELNKFWFFIIIIFFSGIIWGGFKYISFFFVLLITKIFPIKWISSLIVAILSIINGCKLIYNFWDVYNFSSAWDLFLCLVITLLIFEVTISLIYGAVASNLISED